MSSKSWLTLSVEVHAADRPLVEVLLWDWGTLGIVEGDEGRGDIGLITAHFSTDGVDVASLESQCREALGSPPLVHGAKWTIESLPDQDWTAPAREYFRGIAVGERLSVLPPWAPDDHPLAKAEVSIRIDPGMAFGTGTHESTRLMLGWMVDLLKAGDSVLDLGAGSCILSIAAAKMGARGIRAVEIDPEAQENAERNLALNGVSNQVDLVIANFTRTALDPSEVVLCNMLIELFEPHLDKLHALVKPGGTLLLAGFLVADEAALAEGLRAVGFGEPEFRREGEWSSAEVCRR